MNGVGASQSIAAPESSAGQRCYRRVVATLTVRPPFANCARRHGHAVTTSSGKLLRLVRRVVKARVTRRSHRRRWRSTRFWSCSPFMPFCRKAVERDGVEPYDLISRNGRRPRRARSHARPKSNAYRARQRGPSPGPSSCPPGASFTVAAARRRDRGTAIHQRCWRLAVSIPSSFRIAARRGAGRVGDATCFAFGREDRPR